MLGSSIAWLFLGFYCVIYIPLRFMKLLIACKSYISGRASLIPCPNLEIATRLASNAGIKPSSWYRDTVLEWELPLWYIWCPVCFASRVVIRPVTAPLLRSDFPAPSRSVRPDETVSPPITNHTLHPAPCTSLLNCTSRQMPDYMHKKPKLTPDLLVYQTMMTEYLIAGLAQGQHLLFNFPLAGPLPSRRRIRCAAVTPHTLFPAHHTDMRRRGEMKISVSTVAIPSLPRVLCCYLPVPQRAHWVTLHIGPCL
ncbi:uncharacterized protein CCOS01_14467 [Colletotrichum costaricense]|uniref:Uncharacterized protein n=2 Tax=Colletotrichum acutatum species complex TaxID=2707335 RepID=A0AAJ0DUV3_9PEZI|nr:uncharacterized protein CCOS01_14467 [Colletotrichum costaricense]XP_060379693.1 uncharacterized protein CTAM01_09606 [Colletotrichum tamarilloi]KAK1492979.1 hypothetical protein CTAM01_09606 [Colletotrichum tamarilloi]KAK1513525.1 hypothetical protein CCOS01_14467 [Colletotrichum costaricense]